MRVARRCRRGHDVISVRHIWEKAVVVAMCNGGEDIRDFTLATEILTMNIVSGIGTGSDYIQRLRMYQLWLTKIAIGKC